MPERPLLHNVVTYYHDLLYTQPLSAYILVFRQNGSLPWLPNFLPRVYEHLWSHFTPCGAISGLQREAGSHFFCLIFTESQSDTSFPHHLTTSFKILASLQVHGKIPAGYWENMLSLLTAKSSDGGERESISAYRCSSAGNAHWDREQAGDHFLFLGITGACEPFQWRLSHLRGGFSPP